ncbi:MAG: hypothetical protein ABR878_10890 [Roseiarcus sp.]|jgi:hypothetical protein
MSLFVVSRVAYDADAAHARGEPKRPSANPQQRKPADSPAVARQVLEADASEGEYAASTAGLSILAQALAAYSQN